MALPRPPRFHRAARGARRAEARRAAGRSAARDDRDLRPRAEGGRPGAPVRAAEGRLPRAAGGRCRCSATCSARRSASRARWASRRRLAQALRDIGQLLAFLEGARAAEGPASMPGRRRGPCSCRCSTWRRKERSSRAVPGSRVGRRATSILRACRCRPAGPAMSAPLITWGLTVTRGPHKKRQNLGIYRQQVIARDKVIMRWLAHRGGALDFRDHALAHPRHAVPGRGRARRRSGDDPRRGDAGAGHAVRIPVRRPAARRPHRGRECLTHDLQVPATRRDRARRRPEPDPTTDGLRNRARRSVRRPHRLLQRSRALSGVHGRAHHDAPRPDLSLDLHRQAAGRAGGARRRAERSVRAAAAEAVPRDRRLLPAARRLLVPARGRGDEASSIPATPSA